MSGLFTDKTMVITGGTGSFGNAVLERFLDSDLKEIRILSRDELKQDDMRHKYRNEKLRFYIGDVRDRSTVDPVMEGADFVFHAAALKQVPSCEFFPLEAVKTNVLGTDNVLTSAIDHGVGRVIVLSTDKSAYPINAMGMSKALMEKVAVAKGANCKNTIICRTRYGNVLASRGSVIPKFLQQVRNREDLTVTDPNMTRFLMSLSDAVDLVVYAFEHGEQGDLFIKKAPAATIDTIAKAVAKMCGYASYPVKLIGVRHGEKQAEVLATEEEMVTAEDRGDYFRIKTDKRSLYYGHNGLVEPTCDYRESYNSNNADRLDVDGVIALLESAGIRPERG